MLQKAKDFMSDFESEKFGKEGVISMLYLFGSKIKKEQEEGIEDWKSDHEHNLELMKGLNDRIADLEKQIEKMKCYLPVDERDSDHKWFAYKNLFDTEWKVDYSVQGELPKCNTIKWFENKEAVMFYLVSNGMKYYEEPRR